MRMTDLSPKQVVCVACPTCGVAAGTRCLLHSGGLRSEPHMNRKLAAIEDIEQKRSVRKADREKTDYLIKERC
jgi:hypothetical protein